MSIKKSQKVSPDTTKRSKSLRQGRAFSRKYLLIYLSIFTLVGGYVLLRTFAAPPPPPTIYLTPSAQTLPINTTFTVQVRENSGSTPVNAVQANFSYSSSLVSFVSIDTTGTAFATDAPSSGGSGQVSIARGSIQPVTGDQLVATVTFTTKAAGGNVPMAFVNGTVLASASTNLDILGSLAATGGGTYIIDATAPTVSITSPTNNATIAQGTTTGINVTATDAYSAITKVDIYIDGTLKTTLTTSPYSYGWNTTGLSLGSHTIQAKSTDSSGNQGSSSIINVTLADQTAPSTPGNLRSTATTQTTISLAWNASSDNVAVTGYRLQRDGTTITTTSALSYADSNLMPNTSYNYSLVALDVAGNASTPATLTVSTAAPKTGDLNGDNKVDIIDLSILLAHWATADANSDINDDGAVNVLDLSILLAHYGS